MNDLTERINKAYTLENDKILRHCCICNTGKVTCTNANEEYFKEYKLKLEKNKYTQEWINKFRCRDHIRSLDEDIYSSSSDDSNMYQNRK
jgi:hypothetical protein